MAISILRQRQRDAIRGADRYLSDCRPAERIPDTLIFVILRKHTERS